jgi:hypothetical protein
VRFGTLFALTFFGGMTHRRKIGIAIWTAVIVGAIATSVFVPRFIRYRNITIRGAVIRNSDNPDRRSPLLGVAVTATDGSVLASTKTDIKGAFRLTIRRTFLITHNVKLEFRLADYKPLDIYDPNGSKLYVATLVPREEDRPGHESREVTRISHVSVRYAITTGAVAEVGSGVKTFRIVNKGNVPCDGRLPCSPDGKWKATLVSASLDAGPDNEFRNGRVSCIAGPCPFTKIDRDDFSKEARVISAKILGWSDTTTFLLQGDSIRHVLVDNIRRAYPVIFDRTMNFSLPASADGTCIEAEMGGTPIIFPINPNLSLSWTNCEVQSEQESRLYRCELKPGFVFH